MSRADYLSTDPADRPKRRDPKKPGIRPWVGMTLYDEAGNEYRVTRTVGCVLGQVEVMRVASGAKAGRHMVRVTRMLLKKPKPPAAALPELPSPRLTRGQRRRRSAKE